MKGVRSLIDLLRLRAHSAPHAPAYTFLNDGERVGATLTNEQLYLRARAIAATLQASGVHPGDRILLLYPPGLQVIEAFFGTLMAGAIAVPMYPPHHAQLHRGVERLASIVGSAEPVVVLCTAMLRPLEDRLRLFAAPLATALWLDTDDIDTGAAEHWSDPLVQASSIAFLQYTSGSTAAPRGVMVSHHNLLHNLACGAHVEENDADSVSVSWLPVIHDMGLIEGVLQPLWSGYPAYLMAPTAFLQRPLRWLQAITRYQATNSGGPNFAYEHCLARIPLASRGALDLTSWRVAYNGAEPIRRDTLVAFHEAFAPHGFRWRAFYPVYGLAEATLVVSSARQADEARALRLDPAALGAGRAVVNGYWSHTDTSEAQPDLATLVSCGPPCPGTQVEIVDPERHTRCTGGQIGEVWLASESVASGYWGQREESRRTFEATLKDTGEGPFLRTGDLGFLHQGELVIAGRLKDVLIARGFKHFPQDIERTVELAHPTVRAGCCAAFALQRDGREQIAIAAELDPRASTEYGGIIAAIRQAIVVTHGVQVHAVALVVMGGVPRTSSGKVRRAACREAFVAGTLREQHRWEQPVINSTDAGVTALQPVTA